MIDTYSVSLLVFGCVIIYMSIIVMKLYDFYLFRKEIKKEGVKNEYKNKE